MVFLLIFIIIILMIITLRIKVKFKNFKFSSQDKEHLSENYKIEITIYTFNLIPIFRLKITDKEIKKIINNEKIKKVIDEQKTKMIENKNDIDLKAAKEIKNIKIEIEEMNLKILIGTENATLTAFIIPTMSTIIAMILSLGVKEYNEKQIFEITPIYINQNLIKIEFSGIFQIKMIHIINTICIVDKKRKGDKNERTSNRGAYDYGYE